MVRQAGERCDTWKCGFGQYPEAQDQEAIGRIFVVIKYDDVSRYYYATTQSSNRYIYISHIL